jgi:hypothetical protein
MSKKSILILIGIFVFLTGTAGLGYAIYHHAHLPERINTMETLVLGQTHYVPGSQAALRVIVRNINGQSPIADADVKVSLQGRDGGRKVPLFEGTTDSNGAI